ncbi:GAF domain-containing protein [Streptomyces mutabilis]|uniref:GAF domain-containing protein n=1 Tax=Streptomyces mutabilis TaxID=67332 RepID=UPI001F1C0B32|nr:GAF domain-containing protein [Streptomyces mutabilis]MCZ9348769.1 GAF domain-containing protein [Streptomyces mutabilis]
MSETRVMPEQASPPAIAPKEPLAASVEVARLVAVRRYDILDTPPDGAYDRVAALAARLFEVPVATVTIVDEDRIWFKATHGLEGVSEIGRDPGLCASAVLTDDATVIPDTLLNPVACSNPLVAGPMGVRFYAAAPIITADGYRLGTVNVLDTRLREISQVDSSTLEDLAAMVRDQLRLSALHVVRAEQERRKVEQEKRQAEEEARQCAERELPRSPPRCSAPWCLPCCPRYRGWSWPATTRPPPRRRWAAISMTSSPSAQAGGRSSWAMCAARAPKPPRSPR